jgi:AcrR family transcriptional regulator
MTRAGPPTRKDRREQIRRDLLAAATRVFAAKGYQAATVAEIAAEAGYTTGAVYSNFAGKKQLFEAILSEQARQQLEIASSLGHASAGTERLARPLLEMDPDSRRVWLLWLDSILDTARRGSAPNPGAEIERSTRASIAKILASQLPALDNPAVLASALQALWRGWLLGAIATGQSDPQGFVQAINWMISGAGNPRRTGPAEGSRF